MSISKFSTVVRRKPGYLEPMNKLKPFILDYHLSRYHPDGSFLKAMTLTQTHHFSFLSMPIFPSSILTYFKRNLKRKYFCHLLTPSLTLTHSNLRSEALPQGLFPAPSEHRTDRTQTILVLAGSQ